jgi:hypothetical protein
MSVKENKLFQRNVRMSALQILFEFIKLPTGDLLTWVILSTFPGSAPGIESSVSESKCCSGFMGDLGEPTCAALGVAGAWRGEGLSSDPSSGKGFPFQDSMLNVGRSIASNDSLNFSISLTKVLDLWVIFPEEIWEVLRSKIMLSNFKTNPSQGENTRLVPWICPFLRIKLLYGIHNAESNNDLIIQ